MSDLIGKIRKKYEEKFGENDMEENLGVNIAKL